MSRRRCSMAERLSWSGSRRARSLSLAIPSSSSVSGLSHSLWVFAISLAMPVPPPRQNGQVLVSSRFYIFDSRRKSLLLRRIGLSINKVLDLVKAVVELSKHFPFLGVKHGRAPLPAERPGSIGWSASP